MVQLFHMQQVGKSVSYSTYFLKINYNKYVNAIWKILGLFNFES